MAQPSFDKIYSRFLQKSYEQAKALEAESDILQIVDKKGDPPFAVLLQFSGIEHLIQNHQTGQVQMISEPVLADGYFPADYLRNVDPDLYLKVVAILSPDFFHPNVKMPFGWVCLGHDFLPGTTLGDLIFHLYDIISYQNTTVDERDAFNPAACRYLRQYPEVLNEMSRPPIRRRKLKLNVQVENLMDKEQLSLKKAPY